MFRFAVIKCRTRKCRPIERGSLETGASSTLRVRDATCVKALIRYTGFSRWRRYQPPQHQPLRWHRRLRSPYHVRQRQCGGRGGSRVRRREMRRSQGPVDSLVSTLVDLCISEG